MHVSGRPLKRNLCAIPPIALTLSRSLRFTPDTVSKLLSLLLAACLLVGCDPRVEITKGEITTISDDYGTYHIYLPVIMDESPDVVVIVHGTPDVQHKAKDIARIYIERWVPVAEERGVIVISPAFDQENFGGKDGPLGGYRSLQGREIGADEWVSRIVDQYQSQFGAEDSRFYLYGHSAGGQFTVRYMVMHPERIKGAVISAAGRYAWPDPGVPWPYGMGRLQDSIQWPGDDQPVQIDVEPDPAGWLAAAQLPVTVVVGLNDTELQPDVPGQSAGSRVELGSRWVNAMNGYAEAQGESGQVELSIIPGAGHSALGITPYCQDILFEQVDED